MYKGPSPHDQYRMLAMFYEQAVHIQMLAPGPEREKALKHHTDLLLTETKAAAIRKAYAVADSKSRHPSTLSGRDDG